MRCKSCKEDVPPKFTHALSVNVCPLCGKEIMDEKLQEILGELKIALSDAKDYMNEVEDWLLSNYSLKRIKENEVLVDKIQLDNLRVQSQVQTKVKHDPASIGKGVMVHRSEDESDDDVVVDERPATPASVFAKRAGVPNHKKALDFIKGNMGAADPSEFKGIDEEYGDIGLDNANETPLNVREQSEMASIFGQETKIQELELQKLKRLQAQSAVGGGGGGFFRRT